MRNFHPNINMNSTLPSSHLCKNILQLINILNTVYEGNNTQKTNKFKLSKKHFHMKFYINYGYFSKTNQIEIIHYL